MCGGGGGTETVVQKSDPLPVSVTSVSDASTSAEQAATNKQRKKRGQSSNALSTDRSTILGTLSNDTNSTSRNTLG